MPRKKLDSPADIVERKKEHTKQIRGILSDSRLLPNRRLLAELVSLYLDAKKDDDRMLFRMLIIRQFIETNKKVNWNDVDDPGPIEQIGRDDREAAASMKSIWADIESVLKPKEATDAAS